MSEENVELVRRLLEMFASREHEAVFAFYDTDIEWDASNFGVDSASGVPDDLQGIYHGHDGVTDMPPYGLVFTIRNGKVVRWRAFSDQRAALQRGRTDRVGDRRRRAPLDGPAWIRTRDRRIMSPLL